MYLRKYRSPIAESNIRVELENPDCHQKTISNELEMKKGNVSRDIKKLIETGMILGNPIVGYRVKHVPTDNFDNSDN